MSLSALTLVRGRRAHLVNLMKGLAAQSVLPRELVIAWMQAPEPEGLPHLPFPVRHIRVDGEPMPLAAARNRAAEAATGDGLVFLDVDCIPAPGLVSAYAAALGTGEGLYLGEVLYLPAEAVGEAIDFAALDRIGKTHPSKPAMPAEGVRAEPDCGQMWGLSFAIERGVYLRVGGMDEDFVGYGGEETDFSVRLAARGVKLYWTAGARAYHQHHTVHVPPLQQFDAILANAGRFHGKHGRWCMDYWLGQFAEAGFIEWHEGAAAIRVLRRPTRFEIDSARQPADRLFS